MLPSDSNIESHFSFETNANPLSEDLPFHILLLGNWSGDSNKHELGDREPIVIDRDNFNQVMRHLKVKRKIDLYGDTQTLLQLEFNEIDDFHPDHLYRQVALFKELRELRQNLFDPETFNDAAAQIKSWTKKKQNMSEMQNSEDNLAPPDNLLDFILSGDQTSQLNIQSSKQNSELGSLISQIVSDSLITVNEEEQSQLAAILDDISSNLMRTILHHPDFQEIESAWRALFFLTKRIETNTSLKIFILDVSKEELSANFKSVNDLRETFLYRQTVSEVLESSSRQPFSFIGGNYTFKLNVDDTATLIRISRIAAAADAPFVSHITPKVLGVESFQEFEYSPVINLENESVEGKLWYTLRSTNESKYLGLSPMKFLTRLPYGASSNPIETFVFEEFTNLSNHQNYLWSNSFFIIAVLLAKGFGQHKWQLFQYLDNSLDKFPMFFYRKGSETIVMPNAELFLNEEQIEIMFELGLMPLISFRNSDKINVPRFQSVSHQITNIAGRWSTN